MKQINEQGYKDGGAAFSKGKTLRNIMDAKIAMQKKNDDEDGKNWRENENYQQSFELGFADALLAKLRTR